MMKSSRGARLTHTHTHALTDIPLSLTEIQHRAKPRLSRGSRAPKQPRETRTKKKAAQAETAGRVALQSLSTWICDSEASKNALALAKKCFSARKVSCKNRNTTLRGAEVLLAEANNTWSALVYMLNSKHQNWPKCTFNRIKAKSNEIPRTQKKRGARRKSLRRVIR
jgi:hypothetical protein